MKKRACILFAVFLIAVYVYVDNNHALLNDVSVKITEDSGYTVIAVNGKKETRVRSNFYTVVPYVVLEPGRNTIDVQKEMSLGSSGALPVQARFVAEVESWKEYRICLENGVFSLIEMHRK
jgi:hypothetical protein